MFSPHYEITSKILKNISIAEYNKGFIESAAILPSWETQLKKETNIRSAVAMLRLSRITASFEELKKTWEGFGTAYKDEAQSLKDAFSLVEKLASVRELDEEQLKQINRILYPNKDGGKYRSKKIHLKTSPEEILARMVELFDWFNGLEANETHPIILAGVLKGCLDSIEPFENFSRITSDLAVTLYLKTQGYAFRDTVSLVDFYARSQAMYEEIESMLGENNTDVTLFLEFFTEGLAMETSNAREKLRLIAKDTKVAKVTGRTKLTPRQEAIVEHLQDYGSLQNRDFMRLFPNVSEDSVLRDLKALLGLQLIKKTGSTKSSRYELK